LQTFRAASPNPATPAPGLQTPANALPLDISIEAVLATITLCIGLALGAPSLRPIQWPVWAGKIEREGEAGFLDGSGEVGKDFVGNPFQMLETRPGFVDIRKQRKEFESWAKSPP
jgi:membrane magnesium transporter 1